MADIRWFETFGRNSALEAIDQGGTNDNDVLSDYWDNVMDTLLGMDAKLPDCVAASRGFEAVLLAHHIDFRPHGM